MKEQARKKYRHLAAFLLGALPLANAVADDIEIYVGGNSDVQGVRPNILFIIDTSGSMDSGTVTTRTSYDSSIDYGPGTEYDGDCSDDYVYLARAGENIRGCGDNDLQRVQKDQFICQAAASALGENGSGRYQGRFAQLETRTEWRRQGWHWYEVEVTEWDNVDDSDEPTECADDSGTHGAGTAGQVYAANVDGGFSGDEDEEIRWDHQDNYWVYSANWLNWRDKAYETTQSYMEIVREVSKNTIRSMNNVNVGLMRFDRGMDGYWGADRYSEGGMVLHEIENIDTAEADILTLIDGLEGEGSTPLSETLYEAGMYYMGGSVYFGLDSIDHHQDPLPSVAGSRNGNTYISPIQYQCQRNFVVLLTDGEPQGDNEHDNLIENLPGNQNNCSGNCLDEMSEYLYTKDLRSDLEGNQNVITYTIGFNTDQDLLEDTAREGGGKYYTANNTDELTSVLTNIVDEVLAINSTFTAPAVSVNAFNRTVHLNQLFFTIFKPNNRPHWDGNLKRFDLGIPEGSDTVQILDVHNMVAVDPNTGFFDEDATSFWTNSDQSPDGGEASLGGAAGELTDSRHVYTYYAGASNVLSDNPFAVSNKANITKEKLDIDEASDEFHEDLIKWASGIDINDEDEDGSTTDARRIMGDPLHSKPVVVTYGKKADESLDFAVYMTTNDGYLHAVDGDDGSEYFAFIPEQHWPNLASIYENVASNDAKNYGLDGAITPWIHDANEDGTIDAADDHVYLYFGERRGGKNYYALDVTNRESPRFLWSISKSDAGFGELGQTWSQPRLATIQIGETEKHVLIFGGGYDIDLDEKSTYQSDDEGRAIFMVDATDGSLLWRAGPESSGANLEITGMQSSIPSEVRVLDVDGDGQHDRMYVGDMGGRVFRFDIHNGEEVADLVTGGQIASLGAGDSATPTAADNRKFFYPPDAAITSVEGGNRYISLALGSGNQTEPLSTSTQDRFFVIKDTDVYQVRDSYETEDIITVADLYDATDNDAGQGSTEENEDGSSDRSAALDSLASMDGWYIDMGSGEKVLSESVTIQNKVFFTSFSPVAAAQSTGCAPSQGLARAYTVDLRFATPVENYNETGLDDELTKEDRAKILTRGGIPPEVTILFPQVADGQPLVFVGPEQLDVDLINVPVRTYWYETE